MSHEIERIPVRQAIFYPTHWRHERNYGNKLTVFAFDIYPPVLSCVWLILGLAFHEDLTSPVSVEEADTFARLVQAEAERILPGVITTLTGGFRRCLSAHLLAVVGKRERLRVGGGV